MKPTVSETQLLRSRPHNTKLYLSIYEPNTVLSATVTGSVDRGEMAVPFVEVSGDTALVEPGMSLYIGSESGSSKKGHLRVRGITGSNLYVAENEQVWVPGDYLTVVNFYEINAIYPRIISDPDNELDVIFYKDYDIAYTDQNSKLGSFICMGSHAAVWKDEGLFYSASGTFNLKGEALTYDWAFEGGSPTGSSSHTPGTVTYNTPGYYTTKLTVSTTGSAVDVSYRHISVYDRPGEGNNLPVLKWTLEDLTGDRANGGYTGRIKIYQTKKIREGSLIVLFADDRYGLTDGSIGGNSIGRAKTVFVGYVLQGTVEYNWQLGYTEFYVGSPTEVMKLAETFGVSVESKASPTTWYELVDMDVRRAIHHYFKWHSTVLMTNDFEFIGDDKYIQFFDADRSSLYDAAKTLLDSALVGNLVSDRQGKLFAEVDISATNNASGTFSESFTLEKQDWMNTPIIQEKMTPDLSFLEMGGIAYTGPTLNTFSALISNAPGYVPGYRGNIERKQGLALDDQTQLDILVGNVFAFRNSVFPNTSYEIVGNYRNFDIAPQEIIRVNLNENDTPRKIIFNDTPFTNRGINWRYDPIGESFLPILNLALVTEPGYGDTITYQVGEEPLLDDPIPGDPVSIPDIPPDEGDPGGGGGGFGIPPITVPPLPTPTPITGGLGTFVGCNVDGTQTISFTGGSGTASAYASFDNDDIDVGGFWTVAFPTQIFYPYTGYYYIRFDSDIDVLVPPEFGVATAANDGYLSLGIGVNDTTIESGQNTAPIYAGEVYSDVELSISLGGIIYKTAGSFSRFTLNGSTNANWENSSATYFEFYFRVSAFLL